jgi:hypothetical protein
VYTQNSAKIIIMQEKDKLTSEEEDVLTFLQLENKSLNEELVSIKAEYDIELSYLLEHSTEHILNYFDYDVDLYNYTLCVNVFREGFAEEIAADPEVAEMADNMDKSLAAIIAYRDYIANVDIPALVQNAIDQLDYNKDLYDQKANLLVAEYKQSVAQAAADEAQKKYDESVETRDQLVKDLETAQDELADLLEQADEYSAYQEKLTSLNNQIEALQTLLSDQENKLNLAMEVANNISNSMYAKVDDEDYTEYNNLIDQLLANRDALEQATADLDAATSNKAELEKTLQEAQESYDAAEKALNDWLASQQPDTDDGEDNNGSEDNNTGDSENNGSENGNGSDNNGSLDENGSDNNGSEVETPVEDSNTTVEDDTTKSDTEETGKDTIVANAATSATTTSTGTVATGEQLNISRLFVVSTLAITSSLLLEFKRKH